MAFPLIPLLVLGAVSAGTAFMGIQAQKEASRANRRALEEQRKRDNIRAARERAQAAREARIKRAQIVASGANAGAMGSSSVVGGAGSVVSQGASSMSFIDQVAATTNRANAYMQDAAGASSRAATFGAISDIAGSAFSSGGGFNELYKQAKPYFT